LKNSLIIIVLISLAFLIYVFIKNSAATGLRILNTGVSLSSNMKVQKDIVFDTNKNLTLDIYTQPIGKLILNGQYLYFFMVAVGAGETKLTLNSLPIVLWIKGM